MRRTLDQAFLDLRQHLIGWLQSGGRSGIHVFVYPPDWEAPVLARFPGFAEECARDGRPISLVDVGQGFLAEIERRKGFIERLIGLERENPMQLLHDLGLIGERYLTRLLQTPLDGPARVRVLVNTGALGTFVSYSAIANTLHGDASNTGVAAPSVLAFPGEGDDRSLSLLRLRHDTSYRIPRI